jgi:RNA polymerase sigma factor (sigma-70 family)
LTPEIYILLPESAQINQLVDHLFRHESGKLVSVLTRIFGPENLDLAEDVVQDALMEAMNQWSYKEIPENPSAWLYRVAKNKALNIVQREKFRRKYSSDMLHFLKSAWTAEPALDYLFSKEQILDDQLKMMFTCCHPSISADSQIALTLKTLCGFSIPEIAKAFLSTEESINKRLVRARQKIRDANISFEFPQGSQLNERIETILETIYLLFNEGYSASSGDILIRHELCAEAIRLAEMMSSYPGFPEKSDIHALLALMLLNASRFKARQDIDGNILKMQEQERALWDFQIMQKGLFYLQQAASAKTISAYHILAAISSYHCSAPDFAATDWKSILSLYDKLLQIDHSPIILLNRAVALSKVDGPLRAVMELESIRDEPAFAAYHLFYSTMAELYLELNEFSKAGRCIEMAITLSALKPEKDLLLRKLALCKEKSDADQKQ